jgi:integrative and conjugative element protein (TIGR02256 family)
MLSNNCIKARKFNLPHSNQQILLNQSVLEVFSTYRQLRSEPESGGLLFAEFDFPRINVKEVSPPHSSDKRWRTFFIPNRVLQRRLIRSRFKKALHFVGEWHTHPMAVPVPSKIDLESMTEAFSKSHHELNYFLMIIVGNDSERLNLWVSAHNGTNYHQLDED